MSSSIVYFGAQPNQNEAISEALKQKGINLLRLAPSQLSIQAASDYIQPNYSFYISHLPNFMAVACGIPQTTRDFMFSSGLDF
jgi:hypothetical protein